MRRKYTPLLKGHPMTDHSQWGEQAIIAATLAKLPSLDRWCVDVGAGDGVTLSNTRALVEGGYSAVLIEANGEKFKKLLQQVSPKTTPLWAEVSVAPGRTLDHLLADTAVPLDFPPNFDFLSIDIDGHDYHIWAGLKNYTPKLVCIEFNPTMGPELDFIQSESGAPCGSSLLALVNLGAAKGYTLVAVTVTNALFVRNDLAAGLELGDNTIATLWTDRRFLSSMFYDYTGQGRIVGACGSPWGRAGE